MPNVSLKNVPDKLYEKIKRHAKTNRRSINSEILHVLDLVVNQDLKDHDFILAKARKSRSAFKVSMSATDLLELINSGRP